MIHDVTADVIGSSFGLSPPPLTNITGYDDHRSMVAYYHGEKSKGSKSDVSYQTLMGGDAAGPSLLVSFHGKVLSVPFLRPATFFHIEYPFTQSILVTMGITGCAAVVYYYKSTTGQIRAAAMAHVNCGAFEGEGKGPVSLARSIGVDVQPGDIDVVIGTGNRGYDETIAYIVKDGIKDSQILHYYDDALDHFVATSAGCIGLMNGPKQKPAAAPAAAVKKKSGCCFLTTATCLSLGLPDDCEELVKMRWLHDRILRLRDPGHRADLKSYHQRAPAIVEAIQESDDPEGVYRALYVETIRPTIDEIDRGEYVEAFARYKASMERLEERYVTSRRRR